MKSIFIVTAPSFISKEHFNEISSALRRTLENDYYSFLFCDPKAESFKFQVFSYEGEVSSEKLEAISKLITDIKFGIEFNESEIRSNLNRIEFAEMLISQLPNNHDGRNTWLLNYGKSEEAVEKRKQGNFEFDERTQSCELTK